MEIFALTTCFLFFFLQFLRHNGAKLNYQVRRCNLQNITLRGSNANFTQTLLKIISGVETPKSYPFAGQVRAKFGNSEKVKKKKKQKKKNSGSIPRNAFVTCET